MSQEENFETVGPDAEFDETEASDDWSEDEVADWGEEAEDEGGAETVQPEPPAAEQTVDDVELEEGVPVPPVSRRKYPFHKMKPGHSFEVETTRAMRDEVGPKEALHRLRSSLSSSAASFSRRHPNIKMVVRKTGPDSLRCWCQENDDL